MFGALACSESLLVAVERCAAPADEAGGVFRGASLRAGVLSDRQLLRDDGRVGHRPAEACSVLPGDCDAGVDALDELGVLAGRTDARISQLSHSAILTRKGPGMPLAETIHGETS